VDAVQDARSARTLIAEGVDLLSLSGHKMGGLPGGLLYVRQGVPLAPQIVGGAQEDGRRAGTSEVARAVSLALALELTLQEEEGATRALRDEWETRLKNLPGARRLGPEAAGERADHISAWLFGELSAQPVLAQLDLLGVCASSGSACSSHAIEPSRVLQSMGLGERAMGLVRFSFGWASTLEETRRAAGMVEETVQKMMARDKVKR
jgi:cysteine desulfurase